MMKRILSLVVAASLLLGCTTALASAAQTLIQSGVAIAPEANAYTGSTLLTSLTHNCPNTGIMLLELFDPYQNTYLLTVASWVSRPTFTPVAADPNAIITVNDQVVRSGEKSKAIEMTDEPQAVTIRVMNNGVTNTYTIYLQRRPSEKRTRISAGYLTKIYQKSDDWRIDADLVTIKYEGDTYENGNRSTFRNAGKDHYDYVVHPNCLFYYGTKQNPVRAQNITEFINNHQMMGQNFYTIIYIEDEIVCVLPYGADY